jgi:hypothetical protein
MSQRRRTVVWVSFSPIDKTPRGKPTSRLASARYRLLLPAAALEREGWESRVTYLASQANQRTVLARFEAAGVVILGKFNAPQQEFERASERLGGLLQGLRQSGIRVVADFCDDHFVNPALGPVYRMLLNAADAAVASTPGLADVLREHGQSQVTVISDPVEGVRREVAVRDFTRAPVSAEQPLRLLWYGHPLNLGTVVQAMPEIDVLRRQFPLALTLVSSGPEVQDFSRAVDSAWRAEGSSCRYVAWTTEQVFAELGSCDAVLIPSNPHDPGKAIKSPNRFTEAVWGGRFVVAHPLPSYDELARFGWVGSDLAEGLRWLMENPAAAAERVGAGQADISARFTPEVIGRQWKAAIESVLETR